MKGQWILLLCVCWLMLEVYLIQYQSHFALKSPFYSGKKFTFKLEWEHFFGLLALFIAVFFSNTRIGQIPSHKGGFLIGILGVLGMLGGMTLRAWAVFCLKKVLEGKTSSDSIFERLAQAGPYSKIRHPQAAGSLLTFVGLGLVLMNVISLVLILLMTFFLGRKMELRDEALLKRYGDDYRRYSAKTQSLVPEIPKKKS